MPLGLIAKKLGHTRIFDANGLVTPVTVVLAGPNHVLQVKTQASKDGYNSVQLGFDAQKEQRLSKPLLGHIKKFNGRPSSASASSATSPKKSNPATRLARRCLRPAISLTPSA